MSVHLYPVPGAESSAAQIVEPFLENTVSDVGLAPDTQFLILVFGESASESSDAIEEAVRQHGPVAQQALEIGQLTIDHLDERRLNTFTTSLLFNLLSVDNGSDLRETLDSNVITDEDDRKIDYYLPRVNDTVSDLVSQQSEQFETTLKEIYPVDLAASGPREMNNRLEKDIVTDQTIIDYLLLAASSTDDESGVRELVKFIREKGIDDSGYLSGGSQKVSGYQRVFSLSYNLNRGGFNSEFQTARSLYRDGFTADLQRLLNQTDNDIEYTEIYSHGSPVERLLVSRFGGNDRKTGRRILRTINATRAIENNRSDVVDQYNEAKASLEDTIAETRGIIDDLREFNDRFTDSKIEVDTSDVDQFEELVTRAENIESVVAQYLLGVERTQRTSVFETLETRLGDYREELESYKSRIENYIENIDQFRERHDNQTDTIRSEISAINNTSIEIDLPAKQTLVRDLETQWNEEMTELESALPVVDLEESDDSIEETLTEWETEFQAAEEQFDNITQPVSRLQQFSSTVQDIQDQREEMRDLLEEIEDEIEIMEETV